MSCDLANPAVPAAEPKPAPQRPLTRWSLKPPSERDLEIYKLVKIQRREQVSVAWQYEIDASRVSQIVKNVRRWLAAGGAPTDPELRDHVSRQRFARATHKLRLTRAVELATYAMETEPRRLKTTRTRSVGGTVIWTEETTREQPEVDLAAVRLLIRSTEALQALEDQDELNAEAAPPQEQDLLPAIFDFLCRLRARAEADGRLQASSDINSTVATALNTLLGTEIPVGWDKAARAADGPPSDSRPLNMSAEPTEPVAATAIPETPCADSNHACAEKTSQHERPATPDSRPPTPDSSEQLLNDGPMIDRGDRPPGVVGEMNVRIDAEHAENRVVNVAGLDGAVLGSVPQPVS
jgi:hypothetical protein